MTQLGLDYLRHQEQRRSNLANETEMNRANVAKESENLRHNTATEQQAINELAETNRHNVATETLEGIKNEATKQHYERQDAITKDHYERQDDNQLEVANIKATADRDIAKLQSDTKIDTNLNDNQTKRMVELTKLLPKPAQLAVAKAYAKEDPVFAKNFEKAKGSTRDALIRFALGVAAPGVIPATKVLAEKRKREAN